MEGYKNLIKLVSLWIYEGSIISPELIGTSESTEGPLVLVLVSQDRCKTIREVSYEKAVEIALQ